MQLPYWRKEAIRDEARATQKLLDGFERQAKAAVTDQVLYLHNTGTVPQYDRPAGLGIVPVSR